MFDKCVLFFYSFSGLVKILFSALFCFLFLHSKSQDTLTIMQYNLLYYGINTEFCTSTNNNITQKEQNFKKIVKYVKPSVICVNEMDASATIANRFLTNVLNTDGITYYKRADYFNTAGSNTINMLYYDSRRLKYHSHKTLSSYVRDINLYKLYHNSPDLNVSHDTIFIYCAVAHLKAGNTDSDLQARKLMTQYAMGNLNTSGIVSNIMFMGDLNTKSSSEDCFQNLITHSNSNIKFNDPINKLGNWSSNSSFDMHHTQSTNVSSNNCLSGGGMDDRFDFILINNAIKDNTKKVEYIHNSYKALGQDGIRYNNSIIYPSNTSVPSDIANALFAASDHLPVILKLLVDALPTDVENISVSQDVFLTYSVNQNLATLNISVKDAGVYYFNLYSSSGQLLSSTSRFLDKGLNTMVLDANPLKKGLNFLQIFNNEKSCFTTLKVVNF